MKAIEITTKVLAEMLVENRKMKLEEITELYNLTNKPELNEIDLFNKAITRLLAGEYIKEVDKFTYKVTRKAKRMVK